MRDDDLPTLDETNSARARRILSGADWVSEPERSEWIVRACGTDETLLRTVEELAGKAPGRERASAVASPKPSDIGPFRFLELLGEGGMGTVWLAEQTEPIRRRVAIKLIRGDFQGVARHRFEVERLALGRMDHPAIARVLEAGDTPEGRPYLVMELVEGLPIDEWCERRKATLEERLRLFVQVCRGVHHAHQKGVLHRDLKPQNILIGEIDGEPVPRIIDFGIARWLDGAEDLQLTGRGAVVGTPAYLSPEAILTSDDSELDIRSDVYSLGVVLYGLLVSRLPFGLEGESFVSLLRRVADEEPPTPSTAFRRLETTTRERIASRRRQGATAFHRRVRGDLDAIVATALARERDDRYGSAADLAADVERFLENRPLEAVRHSGWHRARIFVRRHRTAVLAAVLLVLSLAGGLVARTLEARRADREAAAAFRAEAEANEALEFLVSVFEVADPALSLGETVTARELLDRGAEKLRRELDGQPASRARLLDTVGRVYGQLGLYDTAETTLEEALEIRELHAEPLERAETLAHLADVHWQRGQTDEARELYRRVLEIRQRELGPRHLQVADTLDDLGMVEEIAGRYDAAAPLLEHALELREELAGPGSEEVADSLSHLGILHLDRGRHVQAEPYLRRALEIREALLEPLHPEIPRALNGVALALAGQGRNEEAIEVHRRALDLRRTALGEGHTEIGQSLTNLANALGNVGRDNEALALLRQAVALWEQTLGPENPRTAIAVFNLGEAEWKAGRRGEAETLFRRALRSIETGRGPDHPHVAIAAATLAELLVESGETEEAEGLYRRALAIRSARHEAGAEILVETARDLAALLRSQGRDTEAREIELRAGVGE